MSQESSEQVKSKGCIFWRNQNCNGCPRIESCKIKELLVAKLSVVDGICVIVKDT